MYFGFNVSGLWFRVRIRGKVRVAVRVSILGSFNFIVFKLSNLRFNINGLVFYCLGFCILGLGSKVYGSVRFSTNVGVRVRV